MIGRPNLADLQAAMRERQKRKKRPRKRRRGEWDLSRSPSADAARYLQVAFLTRRGWTAERIAKELRVPLESLEQEVL